MKYWVPALFIVVIAAAVATVKNDNRVLETKRELYRDCIKDYAPGTELHAQAVKSCALMAESQTRS